MCKLVVSQIAVIPAGFTICWCVCVSADDGLVLGLEALPQLVVVEDSQFTSLPGFVIVSNSTVRFSNVTFSQCNTNAIGMLSCSKVSPSAHGIA